jgi:Leucine-rich repeat (LRR) protein
MPRNNMIGSLPKELGDLDQLTDLDLGSNNRLEGSIPARLANLKQLTGLYLYSNQIEGTIPEELGDLEQLTQLDLGSNRLEGPIPARLAALERLTGLALNGNRLTGVVPSMPFKNYTNYCGLQAATSPSNRFTCPLPPVSSRVGYVQHASTTRLPPPHTLTYTSRARTHNTLLPF